jgi:tryptophan synthase alpha chain
MNVFVKKHKQLSIFTTAGYPNVESLNDQISVLSTQGVDFIEVGIPFSDPMADGPMIQETSRIALKNGMNLEILFEQLSMRKMNIPIVMMGYVNPVIAFGLELFLKKCQEVKVQTVILPDMSLEIYERFYQSLFEKYKVYPCFLITPKTDDERIQRIAKLCRKSFVYLVSSNSTTGSKNDLSMDKKLFKRIKELCSTTPLFIGFGIKTRRDVENVYEVADGAIIGSAFLNAISKGTEEQFLESLY